MIGTANAIMRFNPLEIMMKTILLAADGSTPAERAAEFLARLPHDEKYTLIVATALALPHASETTLTTKWKQLCLEQDRAQATDSFEKISSQFEGANVDVKQIVQEGDAGETICDIARSHRCDLVVIGATGRSAIERILLGSTSDYIATHAPCSVLVVRPGMTIEQRDGLCIAIGYEESGPAQAALEEIEEFKWGKQVELHVVSVCQNLALLPSAAVDEIRMGAKRAFERLHGMAESTQTHLVEKNHIGEGLVNFAEDHHCDILVVGETPRTRLGRVLMGSTTRFVLRHAPCSVWITRNRVTNVSKMKSLAADAASIS